MPENAEELIDVPTEGKSIDVEVSSSMEQEAGEAG